MIRVLTAKGVMSHDELNRMVGAIDAEDGQFDGCCDGPMA